MALGGAAGSALADADRQFLPARFGSGPDSIIEKLHCPSPSQRTEIVPIFCQAAIEPTGDVEKRRSYCFVFEHDGYRFREAAIEAVREATFLPASIDGTPTKVFFPFRLVFELDGEECRVMAIPNLGFQDEAFGAAYVAPQEILTNGDWLERMDRRMRLPSLPEPGGRTWGEGEGLRILLSVAVDEQGNASDRRIEQQHYGSQRWGSTAARALEESRFIPGFIEGAPASMRYYEFLYATPQRRRLP